MVSNKQLNDCILAIDTCTQSIRIVLIELNEIYNDLFWNIYMKIYKKMKLLYEEIKNITDYPPN
jgi:hypothetical protein